MIKYPDVATRSYSYHARSQFRGLLFRAAVLIGVLYWFQDKLMPIVHQMMDIVR